jgi:hypothetical protein
LLDSFLKLIRSLWRKKYKTLVVVLALLAGLAYVVFYQEDIRVRGGVPIRVEIEKWRILPVGCSTTNRPPGKAVAGGMRHGEAYQEVGAGA